MESYDDLYKTICRVCLSYGNKGNMVCLTDENSDDGLSCYGKAVKTFANILITVDKLPKFMCLNCLKILKHAIYFKLKCESSDKRLKQLIKFHKVSDTNFKEVIVDFLMYNRYFPQKTSHNKSKSSLQSKPKAESAEITDELADNCDNLKLDDNMCESNSGTENVDSADEELDRLESMIGQTLFTMPKSKHKSNSDHIFNSLNSTTNQSSTTAECKYKIQKRPSEMKRKSKEKKKLQEDNLLKSDPLEKTSPEKLICNICQKVLANQHTYRYHMERHNGCKFICEHCGKGFPVLVELHMHQVSRHGTGPFLQCPHCTYKAPRKLNLIEHIRIHTGERPYTCDKCGLTFRRSAIWKKHMVYHTEKTVQCPHCPRKFYRRSEMQAHANGIHERMYVYLCHICDATYAKSVTVRRHLTEKHGVPREMQGKITRVNKGEVYGVL